MSRFAAAITPDEYRALVGKEIGVSGWVPIDQATIDRFADLTADHQFIHVDPVRAAAEGPFGGTVAHGFLTLAMLSRMAYEVLPAVAGATAGVNYGFDKVRFIAPVPAGARIRGRFTLLDVTMRTPKELLTRMQVTMEIDGGARPALAAEWLGVRVLD